MRTFPVLAAMVVAVLAWSAPAAHGAELHTAPVYLSTGGGYYCFVANGLAVGAPIAVTVSIQGSAGNTVAGPASFFLAPGHNNFVSVGSASATGNANPLSCRITTSNAKGTRGTLAVLDANNNTIASVDAK